ncbi:MAG: HAD family hydrolase [Ignavibacteriaceae bacterium]
MESSEALKNIKVIFFDLDGTLLSSEGKIGNETKKLVKKLRRHDVHFTFASGRLHSSLINYAEELEIDLPLISLDGSLIKSYLEGKILFESFIKEKYIKKALGFADQYLINIALCHADAIYYTENNSVIPMIMDKFGAKYQEVESYDNYLSETLEVAFAGDNKESIQYIKEKMSFPYSFGINATSFSSMSNEGIFYLHLRKKGTSKGKGALRLLKYLKVKPENSAVVGDWYNDLSLFQTNALKVALANAVREIKSLANIITERTNNEDGTAEFLEMILKAKES